MDKYFNVNFICATNNNEWWSNHDLMSMQLLLNQHVDNILFVDLMLVGNETWIFADKMKKNKINLFTLSVFTWSIKEIIYAPLFKDYRLIA